MGFNQDFILCCNDVFLFVRCGCVEIGVSFSPRVWVLCRVEWGVRFVMSGGRFVPPMVTPSVVRALNSSCRV